MERVKKAAQVLVQDGPVLFWGKVALNVRMGLYRLLKGREPQTIYAPLAYRPLISLAVPVYNVEPDLLHACVDSVLAQSYDNLELCLVDDCSPNPEMAAILREYEQKDRRVKIRLRQENGHIAKATNDAIALCTGEYIAFMDCDDMLHKDALYEVAALFNQDPSLDFVYTDEDKLTFDGKRRYEPFYKPDWSPDTLMSMMYTGHLGVYRRQLVEQIGGIQAGVNGSQDYDFTLRFTELTGRIGHVPRVLYHWRMRPESVAANPNAKPYAYVAAEKAKQDALQRRGQAGEVVQVEGMTHQRVHYQVKGTPLVSVILTPKGAKTAPSIRYPHTQIITLKPGETKNAAMQRVRGEYVLFMDADAVPVSDDWFETLLAHAQLDHAGMVGAKAVDKRGCLLHQGLTSSPKGLGRILYQRIDQLVYYAGYNKVDVNCLALCLSCAMVKTSKWREAGGFDENLPEESLCLELYRRGLFNVLRNDAVVRIPRPGKYIPGSQALFANYPELMGRDPFYSPNLYKKWGDFSFIAPMYKLIIE